MKKYIYLVMVLFLGPYTLSAETLIQVNLQIDTWVEGEEIDSAELLAKGWLHNDPDNENSWKKSFTLKHSEMRLPVSECVGSGCFSMNAEGAVVLSFSSGDSDNVVYASTNLLKDRAGKLIIPATPLKLEANGHDNSSWHFSSEALITLTKVD